jgi:hypothetical protein
MNGFSWLLKHPQRFVAIESVLLQGRLERENPLRESGDIVPDGRSGQIMLLVTKLFVRRAKFYGSPAILMKDELAAIGSS